VVEVAVAPAPVESLASEEEDEAEEEEVEPAAELEDEGEAKLTEEERRRREIADELAKLDTQILGALSNQGSSLSGGSMLGRLTTGTAGGLGLGGFGTGVGTGAGGFGGATVSNKTAKVQPGQTKITGALPKPIIRRVVHQHIPQYKYCYEKQLLKDPSLSGELRLRFVIAKGGDVSKVTIVKAFHPEVDRCVTNVAKRMIFPKPKGGGIVVVSYPFVFQAAGSTPPPPPPPPRP